MAINTYLDDIKTANYGEDVRDSIIAALKECYADATGNPSSYNAAVKALTDLYSSLYTEYNGRFNAIGKVVSAENNTSTVVVSTSTYTKLASVMLTTGRWLIFYGGQWDVNSTGTRWMNVNRDGDGPPGTTRYAIINTGSSTTINETRVAIYDVTGEETIYLWGWQDSGTIINCFPVLTAMQIVGQEASDEDTSDIREVIADLATDVSDAKQDVQDMNTSITTLARQHTEDMYSIREEFTNDYTLIRRLLDYMTNEAFSVDENNYLKFSLASRSFELDAEENLVFR